MTIFDHLGISVSDLPRATAQFHPVMEALGFIREDDDASVSWCREGETELILYPAREAATGPHTHGRVMYPRFSERYYASFVEDDNGIRVEFMYNPPRDLA